MRETLYRLALMLVFFFICVWGHNLNQGQVKYSIEKPRMMVMVDAFEAYSENGTPRWTGIFRDKEFNTRVENPIEPKTYREFVGSNSTPRDMVVKASLEAVKDPKSNAFKRQFGGFIMFLGAAGVLFNLCAVLFFRDPWRFS